MQRIHSHFSHSGIPPRLHGLNVDTLRRACSAAAGVDDDGLEGKAEAIRAVESISEKGDFRGKSGLLLFGPNGCGKTGLLVTLARSAFESGWTPLFVKYTDLVQSVQAGYGKPVNGPSGGTEHMDLSDFLVQVAQTVPLLILDDVGDPFARQDRFHETEDRRKILFQILSARHETERPTHLSANFRGRGGLSDQIGPRLTDRMREMCAEVQMTGVNLRDAS
jgi:DNA replication protein DnaC